MVLDTCISASQFFFNETSTSDESVSLADAEIPEYPE